MGSPSVENLSRRRQLHDGRFAGGEIRSPRWAQLGTSRQVDLDSNGTERLLGCVLDRPHESLGRGIERQDESRPVPRRVPGVLRTDLLARLFSFSSRSGLATLPVFTMLATTLGPRMLTGSLGPRMVTGYLARRAWMRYSCLRTRRA